MSFRLCEEAQFVVNTLENDMFSEMKIRKNWLNIPLFISDADLVRSKFCTAFPALITIGGKCIEIIFFIDMVPNKLEAWEMNVANEGIIAALTHWTNTIFRLKISIGNFRLAIA